MRKTSKILILSLIIMLVVSMLGVSKIVYADEANDSDYEDFDKAEPDVADDKKEETTNENTPAATVTPEKTTEPEVKPTTETKDETEETTSKTDTADKPAPQTGDFVNAKVIALASIAAIGLVVAYAKLKKYNF